MYSHYSTVTAIHSRIITCHTMPSTVVPRLHIRSNPQPTTALTTVICWDHSGIATKGVHWIWAPEGHKRHQRRRNYPIKQHWSEEKCVN